jgi:hypothetical protein
VATSRDDDGPTPNGGVRSTIYYQDAEGNPVDEADATHVLIVEYDGKGESIQRTYGELNRDDAP